MGEYQRKAGLQNKRITISKKKGNDEISDKQNKSKPDTTGKKMSLVELSGRVGDNPQ